MCDHINWVVDVKEEIASGAYGTIYRCKDQQKEMALKCVKVNRRGIPCLAEATIMNSVRHPNLNHALHTVIFEDKLCMLQDLALTDLHRHTREKGEEISMSQKRIWIADIIRAVQCLHRHGIIHADIKASNILLFRNQQVKLADFTLSTKVWIQGALFHHEVCTSTHRPPECLRKQGWSYPLDVWSLGCTLFEIAYNCLLFPYQGGSNVTSEEKVKKELLCIGDFERVRESLLRGERLDSSITSFSLPESFHTIEQRPLNDLILRMLDPNSTTRITLNEITGDPYLPQPFGTTEYSILNTPPAKSLDNRRKQRLVSLFEGLIKDYPEEMRKVIINLTIDIYQHCSQMEGKEESKIRGCLWLAMKLVDPKPALLKVSLADLYPMERRICHYLSFRFPILKGSI